MKTIKFKVWIDTGYYGASHNDTLEVEVDDDATDEQIEEAKGEVTMEWAMNLIEIGHE